RSVVSTVGHADCARLVRLGLGAGIQFGLGFLSVLVERLGHLHLDIQLILYAGGVEPVLQCAAGPRQLIRSSGRQYGCLDLIDGAACRRLGNAVGNGDVPGVDSAARSAALAITVTTETKRFTPGHTSCSSVTGPLGDLMLALFALSVRPDASTQAKRGPLVVGAVLQLADRQCAGAEAVLPGSLGQPCTGDEATGQIGVAL